MVRQRIRRAARYIVSGQHPELVQVAALLRRLARDGAVPVIFGGFLRDAAHYGSAMRLRDLDLVIAGDLTSSTLARLKPHLVRRTRFGGLVLRIGACRVDMWPLRETWGIRHGLVGPPSIDALLRSTFFSIEAMAVVPTFSGGRWTMQLRDHGALQAIAERLLDINMEDNPFPTLCVLRTFMLSTQLQLRLSRRLAAYVSDRATALDEEELGRLQLAHYGVLRRPFSAFKEWLGGVRERGSRLEGNAAVQSDRALSWLDAWDAQQLELLTLTGAA